MIFTVNTADLPSIIEGISVIGVITAGVLYRVLKSAGIKWETIKTKLLVRYDAAKMIQHQDDDMVVSKLGMNDEFYRFLYEIAPGDDGSIDEEAARNIIGTGIVLYNLMNHTKNQKKKCEVKQS